MIAFLMRHPKKLVVLAVILAGGAWVLLSSQSERDKARASQREVVIALGDVEEAVTAQGRLEPKEYVDVGTQVSGQLKVLHINVGDNVKKGDLLAEIDPRIYEARVQANQARLKTLGAQLNEQQAQAVLAKQKHSRNQRLISSNAISKEELEESGATLKAIDARVASIKAETEQSQSTLDVEMANLGYTKIYAPQDGTVVQLIARKGQTLNANQTAPLILQIANLDTMTIRARVAEADIPRLKSEMPVHFTTLGMLEKRWEGKVRQILPSPELVNDVVLYNVLIDVDNRERQLMNGMSTQVFFELGAAKGVPLIPTEALGTRVQKEDNEQGNAYRVKVRVAGKRPEERIIHIGLMNRTTAEVRAGLKEGDAVLIATRPKPEGAKGGGRQGGGGPRL